MPAERSFHFAMVTEGLPGPGYHGGAVAQWAVLECMRLRGHKVTVIGLMDPDGPYARHRDEQLRLLAEQGVEVRLVDFTAAERRARHPKPVGVLGRLFNLFNHRRYDLWAVFDGLALPELEDLRPDGIFCYHFEAVSALGDGPLPAPATVCAVDLYHLPAFERWQGLPPSIAKYTRSLVELAAYSYAMRGFMTELFRRCAVKIEFAPHYAKWFRSRPGCADTLYIPTPVHDPMGGAWRGRRCEPGLSGGKPRILMIGDVTGTATTAGLRLVRDSVLPVLERELGMDGFELRLVGGGTLAPDLRVIAGKPYVTMPGRVMPPDAEFLSADVVLVPTPNTLGVRVRILNAFSYGCCVVAHVGNQAGIPEMETGVNALIADSGEGLARHILAVVRDSALGRRIGEGGRTCFEQHFATTVAGARVVDQMEKAAEARTNRD